MRKRMLIPTLAATLSLLVGACEDTDDVAGVAEGDGTDPAGVQLARYGVTEPPCDGEQHLATVVTDESAYNAFCADAGGRTSVFVMSRAGAEVEVNATTALEHFLAITPDDVAVPEILEHAAESKSGRELTREIVKYVDPRAGPANGSTSLATTIGLSTGSQASFEANQCSKIEDWIDGGGDDFFQTHQWCSGLLGGNAQRTASVQGVQGAHEGRIRVRAYDNTVRVRRYYRNPLNGNWWNASNHTTQPGHLMVWKIFSSDAKWCPGGLDPCQYASDLRFRVEPSTGGKYRYTGGFINYPPEP
ncbi:MAG: hypothetical protein ACREM1_24095 [Longimicrobiales bacterium]